MKRSRKWIYVQQEASRLAGLGCSAAEIARQLEVNQSSVSRWIKSGKLAVGRARAVDASPVVEGLRGGAKPFDVGRMLQTPAEWAAEVRRTFQLDPTDDQLVTLAERALMDAQVEPSASVRMTATKTFQSIAKQLALVARSATKESPAEPETPKRGPLQVVRRGGRDPRLALLAVNE